jgi:hypothetical protein
MSRRELLEAAAGRLGVTIPNDVFRCALRGGFVKPDPQKKMGWTSYPPEAIERLVSYCRFHSRVIARQLNGQRDGKGGVK